MIIQAPNQSTANVICPDSDGLPMSDNTKQFRWIDTIKKISNCSMRKIRMYLWLEICYGIQSKAVRSPDVKSETRQKI